MLSATNCLLDSLKEAPALTCSNARDIAEHLHVKCYRGSDKWVVFKTV